MANFQNSISKGLTALNMKTSNFLEETKIKTHITTLEEEIAQLKKVIGEKVYQNWDESDNVLETVSEEVSTIKEKYAMIDNLKKEIEELSKKEKEVLGNGNIEKVENNVVFCTQCGAECSAEAHFCVKCGNKLV